MDPQFGDPDDVGDVLQARRPACSRRCSRSTGRTRPARPPARTRPAATARAGRAGARRRPSAAGSSAPSSAARGGQPEHDRERRHRSSLAAAGSRSRRPPRPASAARRSSARSRSAPPARPPSRRARSRSCRRSSVSSTKVRSKVFFANAPAAAAGRTTSSVDQLVEVPLVDEQLIQRAAARSRTRSEVPGLTDPDAVGDRDPDQAEHACRAPSPNTSSPFLVCGSYSG